DLAGRGVVTITHGPVRTTYLPVRPSVLAGQTVAAGARIGVVEAVLGHCGQESCLHWGLLRGDAYLDPLSLLGLGPVRLLPWWNAPVPSVAEPGDERRSPPGIGLAGPPAGPPATRPAGTPAATLQAGARSAGAPPASPPVGATTGIGTAVGPIAVAGAAALTMSRALARGRRRRSRHRRDPGRRRRGRR
ncbi:hypothetical protein NE236_42830, partial [Actinoallomurus purpureus]|nr:hypothetical protein [Actinoallomurus purpureus]